LYRRGDGERDHQTLPPRLNADWEIELFDMIPPARNTILYLRGI